MNKQIALFCGYVGKKSDVRVRLVISLWKPHVILVHGCRDHGMVNRKWVCRSLFCFRAYVNKKRGSQACAFEVDGIKVCMCGDLFIMNG